MIISTLLKGTPNHGQIGTADALRVIKLLQRVLKKLPNPPGLIEDEYLNQQIMDRTHDVVVMRLGSKR